MTGEDTYVKATQFRRPDETLAGIVGSVHKDPMRIADDRTPELRRGGQNTKRDKGTTRIVPRIVVAEQWLCFLLGLICTICGICGLFMKYNHDLTPFAHLRWMGPAHGAILRSSAIACFVVGAVLVRCGLASPDQSLLSIGQEALVTDGKVGWPYLLQTCANRIDSIFCLRPIIGFGLKWKGKERTTMKDDVYDIPMVYLLYVLLAIAGIVAAAVILIIRML
jgi:hypothetical protein